MKDVPWLQCPCCFYPVEIINDIFLEEHQCNNPACPLASYPVKVKIFPTFDDAQQDRDVNSKVFLLGETRQFFDILDCPTEYWGYYFIDSPVIDRFRLHDGQPLTRLMSGHIIANWATGISWRLGRPFSVFLVEYDSNSGRVKRDSNGQIILTPTVSDPQDISRPEPIGYCTACKLFRDSIVTISQSTKAFSDPCLECYRALATKVFDIAQKRYYDTLLAVSNPRYENQTLLKELHHTCWLGLVNLAFPIMVSDTIVGFAFTGQLRIKSYRLNQEQNITRNALLENVGDRGDKIKKAFEEMPLQNDVYIDEAFQILREPTHELQMLVSGRYGQMGIVRSTLLGECLSRRTRQINLDGETRWTAYSTIGGDALRSLADHFSFHRAALIVNEGGKWDIAACYPESSKKLPLDGGLTLPAERTEQPASDAVKHILKSIWSIQMDDKAFAFWVRVDSSTWMLFAEREYPNGEPSSGMNVTSRYLLSETARSFHREMTRQLAIFRQIENVLSVAHNLKTPMAGIESGLGLFDATVYHKHLNEMMKLTYSSDYSFLDGALKNLYDRIYAARRRATYEITKMERGTNIDEFLKEPAKQVRITADAPLHATGSASLPQAPPLWETILSAFEMYEGEMEGRNIKLVTPQNLPRVFKSKRLFINPAALQIVVDNLADNSVKYSFDDGEIDVSLQHETKDNKEYCVLSVSNFGNGVLPSEKEKVWDLFYRGMYSSNKTLKVTGTGSGLYLIKRIVEHCGGYKSLESTFGGETNRNPGEGYKTTITVAFPLITK